jgi:hypothetical protein
MCKTLLPDKFSPLESRTLGAMLDAAIGESSATVQGATARGTLAADDDFDHRMTTIAGDLRIHAPIDRV